MFFTKKRKLKKEFIKKVKENPETIFEQVFQDYLSENLLPNITKNEKGYFDTYSDYFTETAYKQLKLYNEQVYKQNMDFLLNDVGMYIDIFFGCDKLEDFTITISIGCEMVKINIYNDETDQYLGMENCTWNQFLSKQNVYDWLKEKMTDFIAANSI